MDGVHGHRVTSARTRNYVHLLVADAYYVPDRHVSHGSMEQYNCSHEADEEIRPLVPR